MSAYKNVGWVGHKSPDSCWQRLQLSLLLLVDEGSVPLPVDAGREALEDEGAEDGGDEGEEEARPPGPNPERGGWGQARR